MDVLDLSEYQEAYKSLERKLESLTAEDDPASLLIAFPLGEGAVRTIITCDYAEFTAFCPWTRFPDQGSIHLEYLPNGLLLELKSWKYYLLAFRDRHITQEHVAQKIYNDLYELLDPGHLLLDLDYMPRGGIHTVVKLG